MPWSRRRSGSTGLFKSGKCPSQKIKRLMLTCVAIVNFLNPASRTWRSVPARSSCPRNPSAKCSCRSDRREYLDPYRKEYEELDKELKDVIKSMASEGQSKFVIGKWVADVVERNRKGYVVQPTTYKVISFVRP